MYQDPEIAAIIKNLDRKKQEYVHGNNLINVISCISINYS